MFIHENKNAIVFSLFPNPSNGDMQLNYAIKPNDKGVFKVYDVTGKLIDETILNSNGNSLQLNSYLNNGIYFYQIIVNNKTVKSDKFVVIGNE